MKIPIVVPHLGDEIIQAVADTIRSGWIGQTEKVAEFEKAFASKFGYKYALAVNSCTSALRLALSLAGIGPKDEVITTPNTFPATNTVILEQFAVPIFADIQYETGNIDPKSVENLIGKRTKAIMAVHWMGYPADLKELYEIAEDHDLVVIEDAAQAIGATYKNTYVGSDKFGCFSFQAVKQITTGDGGMLTTNNEEIYKRALKKSWFGFLKEERSSSAKTGTCNYDITELGFKYRMNAINAVMGLVQLKYLDELLSARKHRYMLYRLALDGLKGITLFNHSSDRIPSPYMFPIHVRRRKDFLDYMQSHGIEAFVHNDRNDRFTLFGGIRNLPNMEKFDADYVCLPIHHKVDIGLLEYIIHSIKRGW